MSSHLFVLILHPLYLLILLLLLGRLTECLSPLSRPSRFLVVGGNGRVGGSTAKHLHILSEAEGRPVELILGGRSETSFATSKARIIDQLKAQGKASLPAISFQAVNLDIEDPGVLTEAIKSCRADCVVHTAGPFQQRTRPVLLEASISAGVPYVDVCDEPPLCKASKELQAAAVAEQAVAVVAGGIWPGVSALMAAEAVHALRRVLHDGSKGEGKGAACSRGEEEVHAAPCDDESVDLSFFTAGTGNAGATIVSATFLLLCQPALTLRNGLPQELEPWTSPLEVDFGRGVGIRTVRLLDNPDVYTLSQQGTSARNEAAHDGSAPVFQPSPNIRSRFATAPAIWNQLFGALKTVVPPSILADRELMQKAAIFSLPIIRVVDKLVGATNAMRVDATGMNKESGTSAHVRFSVTHDDLEQCVGLATAAFALELMSPAVSPPTPNALPPGAFSLKEVNTNTASSIPPGIYFPSELPPASRQAILERVKGDASVWEFEVNTSQASS